MLCIATPHRGSSYLYMSQFAVSIQKLLQLRDPLPSSLRSELLFGHHLLAKIDEDFKVLSSEMRIWTFSETEDSKLSGSGVSGPTDIQFTAPITPLKSAILGVRHEKVYTLQGQHADCASFGIKNLPTMKLYVDDLGDAIRKACDSNSTETTNNPMRLEQEVSIEVHGFYENAIAISNMAATEAGAIQAFSTKQPLALFLDAGPDELLDRRLREVDVEATSSPTVPLDPLEKQFIKTRTRSLMSEAKSAGKPFEQPQSQRNLRRSSVAEAPPKADRDPPLGLGLADTTTNGAGEASASDISRSDAASVAPLRASGLHPGYFPMPPPVLSLDLSPTRSNTLISGASSTDHARPTVPRTQTYDRNFAHQVRLDAPTTRKRSGSESTFNQDVRVSFLKPNRQSRKFVWVHIPFTNPTWIRKVFATLEVKEGRGFSELFSPENWSSRHTRGRHAQHHACFVKPACSYVSQPLPSELGTPALGPPRHAAPLTSRGCLYLYFPFLHFDTYSTLIKRRDIIGKRLAQGRSKPVPLAVASNASLEQRVIWEFLGHDPPINCRRTLDQYRYPSLQDTRARDDDQMLYKMTKEKPYLGHHGLPDGQMNANRAAEPPQGHQENGPDEESGDDMEAEDGHGGSEGSSEFGESDDEEIKPEDDILNGNVLMVDQMWLWVIDTCEKPFPRRMTLEGIPSLNFTTTDEVGM